MKMIINFTPTGMIPTKEMNPYVPVTPEEIIEEVLSVRFLVTMVHLHARDEEGIPTYRAEVYEKIIQGIREVDKDLVLCVSLSGRTFPEFEQRVEPLKTKPDMGSLTLSSVNFNKQASVNTPNMIQRLAEYMLSEDVVPELEVFDVGMINYAKYLIKKGLIQPPYYFNLIVGNVSCAQLDLNHIGNMIKDLPLGSLWSLGGVGKAQYAANVIGIAMGGGVRVGLEDNIWYDQKRMMQASNRDLILRLHQVAQEFERDMMTPQEFREMML